MKDKNKDEIEDLEDLFKKIEDMPKFKKWFGTKCRDFNSLCASCWFWNKWEKLKIDLFERYS